MQDQPNTQPGAALQAQPAQVQGQAAVIRAQPATIRATIHVTRKATGKVDTYEIVGTPVDGEPKEAA